MLRKFLTIPLTPFVLRNCESFRPNSMHLFSLKNSTQNTLIFAIFFRLPRNPRETIFSTHSRPTKITEYFDADAFECFVKRIYLCAIGFSVKR